MAITHFPSFVLDCPDPGELARFYGELLGWEVSIDDDGTWAEVRGDGQCVCFQRVEPYAAPDWPGQDRPQQVHLDVVVDDLDIGESTVLAIGAQRHPHQRGATSRVLLDPAGHPFCLCES